MFRNIFDGWHIVILVILVIVIFGWKRLPDAARSLGRSARILKSEMGDMKSDGKSEASGQTVPGQTTSSQSAPPPPSAPQQQPNPYPQAQEDATQAPQHHSDGTNSGA